jgi:hypothetical protein
MAVVAITSTAQAVTLPPGTPVTVSAACTIGFTQAGAASGPTVNGSFNWPGIYVGQFGGVTMYVQTATTANLNYPS